MTSSKKRKKRYITIILAVFFCLTIPLVFFAKPIKRSIWEWRFNKAISATQLAIEDADGAKARDQFKLAWQLSNKSYDQVKQLLDITVQLHSQYFETIAFSITHYPEFKTEDAVKIANHALAQNNPSFISRFLPKVKQEILLASPELSLLKVNSLAQLGSYDEAISILKNIKPENQQQEDEKSIALLQLLSAKTDNPFSQKQAISLIKKHLKSDNDALFRASFEAMKLIKGPGRYFKPADLYHELDKRSALDHYIDEYLLALSLEYNLSSELGKTICINRAIDRFSLISPKKLNHWLLLTRHPTAAAWVAKLPVDSDPHSFIPKIQALIDINEYDKAFDLLKEAPAEINQFMVEGLRSGLMFKKGNTGRAVYYRNRALKAAAYSGRYQDFYNLLILARKFGDETGVKKIAHTIISIDPSRLPHPKHLNYLEHILAEDTEELIDFYRTQIATLPKDPYAKCRFVLLSIAQKEKIEEATELITAVASFNTSHSSVRAIEALCLAQKANTLKDAQAVLSKAGSEWPLSAQNEDIAIYASALAACEMRDEADRVSAKIEWAHLPAWLKDMLQSSWPDNHFSS